MATRIARTGSSLMVVIPAQMIKDLGLQYRDRVELSVEGDSIIIRPQKRPRRSRFALSDLLAACDPKASPHTELIEWDREPPKGMELIQDMERGDVYEVELDGMGRETHGRRRIVILTPHSFNKFGTPIVVPVMTVGTFERYHGFTVSLIASGGETTGVAICNQPRALDIKERHGRFIERVSEEIVNEIIERMLASFD